MVSTLFLDISGAYPNTVIEKVLHNVRKRGIPIEHIEWLRHRLEGRQTVLCFDDYRLDPLSINNGADQGCPILHLIYIYYNADLIEPAEAHKDKLAEAFIDDVLFSALASTLEEAHNKLANMMT